MEALEIIPNKEACRTLGLRDTAELGIAILNGKFSPNIGIAFAPGENGNKHWVVKVYKNKLQAWANTYIDGGTL